MAGSEEDIADLHLPAGYFGASNTILNLDNYGDANFLDADEVRPSGAYMEAFGGGRDSLQGMTQQILSRHLTEASTATHSPALTSFNTSRNNWRKKLREMLVVQNETVFSFLFKPAQEHPVIGPVQNALSRYAIRQDVDTSRVAPLRTLLQDLSGATQIQAEIDETVSKKGPSSLGQLKEQVMGLIELYKTTGELLLEAESQLKLRLEKMDKIQKRVSIMMELQTNEATPELVTATEHYLQAAFRDMSIEQHYKIILQLYQKHIALREAIQVFKTGATLPSEPVCPICITEPVACAIVPCGHTFCGVCARRMMAECSVCRGRIRDRLKLFFS